MSKKHAENSPSSADRWTTCTASTSAQRGIPNENSDASRAGTTCHQIQEEVLLNPEADLQAYLGRTLVFWRHDESESRGEDWLDTFTPQNLEEVDIEAQVLVTQEMVDAVDSAVTFIREQHELLGGKLLVEQRVPIGQFTGEDDAHGSADVILLGDTWIHVMDSKFGRKRVNASKLLRPASVELITGERQPEKRGPNLQMACYALGAVHANDPFEEIKTVTMTIIQPFISHTDSYSCSIEELREVEAFLRTKSDETRTNPRFDPTYDNCFYCRAKDTCDARSNHALSTVFDGFPDATHGQVIPPNPLTLGSQYALVSFVRDWADSVERAVYEALQNGEKVVRGDGLAYKLVAGKAAAREWDDAAAAERLAVQLRLKREHIYNFKLKSPTQMEALSKAPKVKKGEDPIPPVLGPRQWAKLADLIAPRGESKPQIALETDPKPAIERAAGFGDVAPQEPTFAELFGE